MESAIERIRKSLSISWAWRALGLPGKPARECRSPFRIDKKPSFSVYRAISGERWWDHGEGIGGDIVDFWARAQGISIVEAVRDLSQFLSANEAFVAGQRYHIPPIPPEASPLPAETAIRWPPDIRAPTELECRALGLLRGLHPSTFQLAGELGTLKIANVYQMLSWIVTDAPGIAAQARRFDGQMYRGSLKSFALPGSRKNWPVGLKTNSPTLNQQKRILLVEGGPDYFAALQLCAEGDLQLAAPGSVRPIAMLGASCGLGEEAGKEMVGAQVVIVPHNDEQGSVAAEKWVNQLRDACAARIVVQRLPVEVKDLNDFLRTDPPDQLQLFQGFESECNTKPPNV